MREGENMEMSLRDKKLQNKYPQILKNLGGDPSETCMSWMHGGISVGDGWIPLLEELFAFCQFHHDNNGYPQLVADQIKEKFGTLRFYYHFDDCTSETSKWAKKFGGRTAEYLEGACAFAESMSSKVCESCGKPGRLTGKHWKVTTCEECEKKH